PLSRTRALTSTDYALASASPQHVPLLPCMMCDMHAVPLCLCLCLRSRAETTKEKAISESAPNCHHRSWTLRACRGGPPQGARDRAAHLREAYGVLGEYARHHAFEVIPQCDLHLGPLAQLHRLPLSR